MDTLLFKNTGLTALEVGDLGIYLEAGEETDLLVNFGREEVIESANISAAMSGDGEVTLNQGGSDITLTYVQLIEYLTALTRYDKIDFTYISGKDDDTDVTGAELEALTNGSDVTTHIHDNRYYTETELQTSGSSSVHWGNITNAPQFGALNWKSPVDRSDTSYGAGTVLPLTGNILNDARMVADDGDGKPAQYVCIATSGTWSEQWIKIADVDWGAANSISVSASGNLSSTDVQSALEELQGDIDGIDLDYAYNNGSVVTVDDTNVDFQLSSGKSFIVSSGVIQSLKVTGTTTQINGSLDVNGGAITLDAITASNFSVTAANLTLSTLTSGNVVISSAGGLTLKDQYLTSAIPISQSGTTGLDSSFTATSIIGAINELMTSGGAVDTLDDAYDGPTGSGSGRTIIVDSGSVKLDATSSTYAPIELTQQTAAPSSGLAAGQLTYVGGQLYAYDGTRSKWLSADEKHYFWGTNVASGKYIQIGDAIGTTVGFRIPVNATITKVTASVSGGNLTKEIEIRKNGSSIAIKTFSLVGGVYTSINDNIDITAGDSIQVFIGAAGGVVKNPVISVYLKWKI